MTKKCQLSLVPLHDHQHTEGCGFFVTILTDINVAGQVKVKIISESSAAFVAKLVQWINQHGIRAI